MKTLSHPFCVATALIWWGIFGGKGLASEKPCERLNMAIDIAMIQRTNLMKKQKNLQQQFKESAEKDFDDQTDGILESLSRNKAKKIFFVKKQLQTKLESKTKKIQKMEAEFCKRCRPEQRNLEFCIICPRNNLCL